jgi:pimeloyl-ACP methyl ester carboxylesterase
MVRLVDPCRACWVAGTFPFNRVLLLPDSGHVSQMEHPGAVAAAIRRLVETPSSPAA